MKKISSYSIIELIVVMLISTLVISFCYTALEFTSERNNSFEQKQEMLFEHESLINQLQKDIFNATTVLKNGENIIVNLTDSSTHHYTFGDTTILKINQQIIIFKVKTNNSKLFYLGEIQYLEKGVIDKICFTIRIQQEPIEVTFLKTYGADVLLINQHERN